MHTGLSGTRESKRRGSAEPANQTIQAQTHRCENALDLRAARPLTALTHTHAPLAPLQRVTPDHKRQIAQYLGLTEAVWFMLSSRDMHQAVRMDRWLRLDEIASSFQALGVNELIQGIRSNVTVAAPTAPLRSIMVAGHQFKIPRSPRAEDLQPKERRRQAEAREGERERAAQSQECRLRLERLEPDIEGVVFHFAAQRHSARPVRGLREPTPAFLPVRQRIGRLHQAIEDGDVEKVRTDLREFLSLSPALIPNARKVAWLREPQGMRTLEAIGVRRCGTLQEPERRMHEAVAVYVDEIVSSSYLLPSEKLQLCVRLERARPDAHSGVMNVSELDIVRYAIRHGNPAVAASIIRGIYNSRAEPQLKQSLLAAIAGSWDGGLASCVDRVIVLLMSYAHQAPEWVGGVIADLEKVRGPRSS